MKRIREGKESMKQCEWKIFKMLDFSQKKISKILFIKDSNKP